MKEEPSWEELLKITLEKWNPSPLSSGLIKHRKAEIKEPSPKSLKIIISGNKDISRDTGLASPSGQRLTCLDNAASKGTMVGKKGKNVAANKEMVSSQEGDKKGKKVVARKNEDSSKEEYVPNSLGDI